MRQYLEVKEGHADAIVLFRLGDFYEMFFEDAVLAARLLDLTLTSRDKGKEDGVPMCGVPHHAARGYIAKLTDLGHKVVICEQTEDAKLAKGLVKREVVRIVTPGIVLDDEVLDPRRPRYVAALVPGTGIHKDAVGLAYLDVTTGELAATVIPPTGVIDELTRVAPREVLCAPELLGEAAKATSLAPLRARYPAPWNAAPIPSEAAARTILGVMPPDSAHIQGDGAQPRTTSRLRQMLDSGRMVAAPFVLNAFHARIAESVGFQTLYMTGFGTAAERGYPDVGLVTQTEMAENARSKPLRIAIRRAAPRSNSSRKRS